MNNLIFAGFSRIRKSRILWVELGIALVIPVFTILNGYFETNISNAWIINYTAQFFGYAPCVGIFIAIFSSWLWGNDYEYGTLRNKLICGHSRRNLYLSHLLISAIAGIAVTCAWLAVNLVLGIPLLKTPTFTLSTAQLVICTLSSLLMAAALASVCCMLASLMESKSGSLLLCLLLVVAMVIAGLALCDRFSEPEISLNAWVWYNDNPSVKWHPENDLYVGGWARIAMELLMCILPGAQGVFLNEQDVEHFAFPAVGSLFTICLTTFIGIRLFQKKDLK